MLWLTAKPWRNLPWKPRRQLKKGALMLMLISSRLALYCMTSGVPKRNLLIMLQREQKLPREAGMPESVVAIIKRHVGGGITTAEAKELGWPDDNYLPVTLEEKIVSYADKLVETTDERVPIEETINKFQARGLTASAERVRKIHDEIAQMCGEKP